MSTGTLQGGFCLGRWLIDPPAGAELIGRRQRMVNLRIEVEDAAGASFDALAKKLGAEAAALRAPAGTRSAVVSSGALGERAWGVVFVEVPEVPEVVELRALRATDTKVFRINGKADREQAEGLFKWAGVIASAIRAPADASAAAEGFCIDQGVVALPFQVQESAEASFRLADGARLSIATRTIGSKVPVALSAEAKETLANLAARGFPAKVLRSAKRAVGGLPGEELLVAGTDGRSALYQWRFTGKPKSGTDPFVEIVLDARDTKDASSLVPVWDAALNSLRRKGR